MSIDSVKRYFIEKGLPLEVIEPEGDTSTVESAARAIGVEPDMIAKTLAFKLKERNILILTKGGAKTDNKKFKSCFNEKAKFIPLDEVEAVTGHKPGGVCPFGLANPLDIYLDISLKEFEVVYPAGGSSNSAVRIDVSYLEEVTGGTWVDVTK